MVSVAEQFSTLRNTLGSVLGIFTLLRWFRTLFAKITGRPPPADATSLTPANFFASQGLSQPATLPDGTPVPARPSKKPFLVFLLAVFGLPYLMAKLIRALARSQEEEARRLQQQGVLLGPDGRPLPPDQQPQQNQLDPSKLDFCRLIYDYTPESSASGSAPTPGIDLDIKKGDLVAVLSKSDPLGNPSEWWRCRARDGRVGYLPSPYLETVQRRPKEITGAEGSSSRASTLSSSGTTRTVSLTDRDREREKVRVVGPKVEGKVGDVSVESFQKSQFYS